MNKYREKKERIVILSIILIAYVVLLFIGAVISVPQQISSIRGIDKVVHFGEYLLLGIILVKFLQLFGFEGRRQLLAALAIGLVLMVLSEFIQSFVPGRSPDILDLTADFLGFIIGVRLFK